MDDKTRTVLLEVSGFLTLLARGLIVATDNTKMEARQLLDKIGELFEEQS